MSKDLTTDLGVLVRLPGSASLSSPVAHIDIDLPAGFSHFLLITNDIGSSDGSNLAMAFGQGGAWWNDASGYDTYSMGAVNWSGHDNASTATFTKFFVGWDALMVMSGCVNDQPNIGRLSVATEVWIYPGSSDAPPSVRYHGHEVKNPDSDGGVSYYTTHWLNASATITPTYARIDKIRLVPYTDSTVSQTSATLSGGAYSLYGVPTL